MRIMQEMQHGFNVIRMYLFIFIVIQSISVLRMETIHFIDRHCGGERPAFIAQPFGETLQSNTASWDVIETPGHTTDHLSFYNRETGGAMFTGDLFIQPKTKVVLDEENIVHTLASLRKIVNYDFDVVYCCHAGYIEDGRTKIQEKIDYLVDMEGKVKQLFMQGYSVEEITKTIFPRDYPITKVSGEQWSSKHIITAFINHFTQESFI